MISDDMTKKLETYFGFLRKSKGVFVGRSLEMRLKKDEINYLIIFPQSCSTRSKDDLLKISSSKVRLLEYTGDINIHEILNQKDVKAIGIKEPNLGKKIFEILSLDMESK